MNPEEYANAQAVISAATARYVLQFSTYFKTASLSITEWLGLLQLMFPQISQLREESAALGRTFYDAQRSANHPDLDTNARLLEPYKFEWFVQNMEVARQKMSQEDSPDDALGTMALRAVREVENGGRKQIIHAVEDEPATHILRGWTRVATGRETCAWCLMLISRGPTYVLPETAGLDLDDDTVLAKYRDAPDLQTFFDDIEGNMTQWHDGCDCKVVPVFKSEAWPGEQEAKKALELWNDATKVAVLLRKADPDAVHLSGKNKGQPFTRNEDVINVMRQMLADGDINMSEFAAAA